MALTDTKLRRFKPRVQNSSESEGGGLFIEVTPKSAKVWHIRYRLDGMKEKVALGENPAL